MRVQPGFAGPDPDCFLDVRDEYLAVPDPAGLGSASDRLNGFFDHVVAENNFDLNVDDLVIRLVEKIEPGHMDGVEQLYFHLRLLANNSKVMVPKANIELVGLLPSLV